MPAADPDDPALFRGATVRTPRGAWTLGDLLGVGSQALVFEGLSPSGPAAIKVLRPPTMATRTTATTERCCRSRELFDDC